MPSEYKCDCGNFYVPNEKYKDSRVKCNKCIKTTRSMEVKEKSIKYLGGKCVDCGFSGHPVAFDFDHIEPENKSFKISGKAIYRWKELKAELDKCQLRCSNCHRIKHYLK
jgi:excinuclease UvrABC ATPase subunit